MEAGRTVVQGTCGWSDPSLLSCGRFYPPRTSTSAEKLAYYSRHGEFGCVEVDSSTYAVPKISSVKSWLDCVPSGFVFHFKAFGLFCLVKTNIQQLPYEVKQQLTRSVGYITFDQLGQSQCDSLWSNFNAAVAPALAAKKLGLILFQFQTSFKPGETSRLHLEYCARNLCSTYPMAVEFRSRDWLTVSEIASTMKFLRSLRPEGVVLVASDDLENEMSSIGGGNSDFDLLGNGRLVARDVDLGAMHANTSLVVTPPAQGACDVCDNNLHQHQHLHMPLVLSTVPSPQCCYIRVHRRVGEQRVLSAEEVQHWVARITALVRGQDTAEGQTSPLLGPIYFLWGTDFEDQPLINARKLARALPADLLYNWSLLHVKNKTGDIKSMFAAQVAGKRTEAHSTPLSSPPAALASCEEIQSIIVSDSSGSSAKFHPSPNKNNNKRSYDATDVPTKAGLLNSPGSHKQNSLLNYFGSKS